ncbi:MAG: N-acetylmuramoyl-L-alanine amidase [Clostridiaceae bacterium]
MSNTLKLAVDIGHNVPYDRGAQGIKSEDQLNFEVGKRLMEKCSGAGIRVIDCTPENVKSLLDSLNKRVEAANNSGADFFLSIHHNAFPGARGTEILCIPGGNAEAVSKVILPEIIKLGFKNRGVKARYDLYVLNETRMPATLVECAFCDSEEDMRNYDPDKMAGAIFSGICKAFNISSEVYHVVEKGETLWGISRLYNTEVRSLVVLNGIIDASVIYPGQRIRIR